MNERTRVYTYLVGLTCSYKVAMVKIKEILSVAPLVFQTKDNFGFYN